MGKISRVCVNCGSSPGLLAEYREAARQLGQCLAGHGIDLVFGGADAGLMGVVANAAMASGGRVIPGSMGTESFHVDGRGCEESLCSSSHGAGRAMSRDEARRHISAHQVQRDLRGVWFDARRINGLREEAPSAYKDIRAVMRAQKELIRIIRTLMPILCYKGTG